MDENGKLDLSDRQRALRLRMAKRYRTSGLLRRAAILAGHGKWGGPEWKRAVALAKGA